jgi:hypothetical protein
MFHVSEFFALIGTKIRDEMDRTTETGIQKNQLPVSIIFL